MPGLQLDGVVGNRTIFAVTRGAHPARIDRRFFHKKMHRGQRARDGELPVAGEAVADGHVVGVADDLDFEFGMFRENWKQSAAARIRHRVFTTASPELNITRSRMFTVSLPFRLEIVTSLDSRSERISSSKPLAI